MVGLVGIVTASVKNDIDIEKLLSQMCDVVKHDDKHKIESHIKNNVGLGRVHAYIFNPSPQPIFNENRTISIVMDGEVYNYQNMKNELISKGYKFSITNNVDNNTDSDFDNCAEFILHLYEEYGKDFVHKLNGNFSIVIWNGILEELLIVSDRYGLRPVYYTNNNGYLLFGSEVKAILQDKNFKKVIDNRSIIEFFSFGYILGNKTFFNGIELVPPGSIMTYKDGNISIEQYWDFDFNKIYNDYSENYYIDKLSKLIAQAVERQMKGNHRMSVLLSGGLDSRTILASIPREYSTIHGNIHTVTYGKKDCNDAKFANILADELGTIHHFYEFKPEDISVNIEELVYITDGMLNIFNAPRMQTYKDISRYADVTLHGWIGDSTMGDFLPESYLTRFIENQDSFSLFKRLCNYSSVDLLRNLFNNSYFPIVEKSYNLSKDYISNRGKNVELKTNRLMYLNLKERQRRIISVGFIYMRNWVESRTPFTDHDYIDFSLTIPPELKLNKYLYKKMILKTFPQFKEIPYGSTGLPLYKSNFLIKISTLSKLAINKITRKIFGYEIFSDGGKNLANYGNWIRDNKNLKDYIYNILLDKRTLERPYFNHAFIKQIIGDHMENKKDYSTLIGLLLTFELWNRQFIDK